MSTDPEGGGEIGLLDATLVDAVRLIGAPASLPRVAMTLPTGPALVAGALSWSAFIGAVAAGIFGAMSAARRDADERLVAFVSYFGLGGVMTVCLVIPLALYASLDADLTSEHHRARVRF